jgi:ferredoxin
LTFEDYLLFLIRQKYPITKEFMKRKIVKIIEEKCDGCGLCIPNCAEGALQVIDGKARLVSDLFCDGLGACLGKCPQDAIVIEEREAGVYDEDKVMDYIVNGGPGVIKAHLKHLKGHNEIAYLAQAKEYLFRNNISFDDNNAPKAAHGFNSCPGSRERVILKQNEPVEEKISENFSELSHWPIQLHLISPLSASFRNADVLLAADCVAFSYGNFHKDFLRGKALAIACPKLDSNKQVYLEKIITMITEANINSITVVMMEVPCCSGLLALVKQAVEFSKRELKLSAVIISLDGKIIENKALI